jgi:hypothetical protein
MISTSNFLIFLENPNQLDQEEIVEILDQSKDPTRYSTYT